MGGVYATQDKIITVIVPCLTLKENLRGRFVRIIVSVTPSATILTGHKRHTLSGMTDMIKADEVVLKTDKLGVCKRRRRGGSNCLDEFERSGLSGKKFADVGGHQVSDVGELVAEAAARAGRRTSARQIR